MNLIARASRTLTKLLCLMALASPALSAPGAHGPNGEHLDGPASAAGNTDAAPKMEAQSEDFELVATLSGGELSILIDRYQTNEPVLDAKVELESGGLKAVAKFHADHGDYAVDDSALLKALGQPGAHPLVITLIAGKESDLLEGTLNVTAADDNHGHAQEHGGWTRLAWIAGTLALLGVGALLWQRRRGRQAQLEVSP
ncbi:MAG: hypothetical protein H7Z15_13785 [Rhizobacter sp.]|nr:hypothetical protein [Rhizobacter sp.]